MSKPQDNYLITIPDCKEKLQNKHLLIDANIFISLLEDFNAITLFDYLNKLNVTLTVIHPVLIELQNTNSSAKRLQRQSVIKEYNFTILPLTAKEFEGAKRIQVWLSNINRFPSPTDLYLGGVLYHYGKNILLATSNLSDFPLPLFKRECFILLQNKKRVHTLSFVSIDDKQLVFPQ